MQILKVYKNELSVPMLSKRIQNCIIFCLKFTQPDHFSMLPSLVWQVSRYQCDGDGVRMNCHVS
jgi:hypothetical protein